MNQVEFVKQMCKERNISIHKLEMDCKFGNGYISQLKKGVFPADRAAKIADYFGVPIDILLNDNETTSAGVDLSAFPQQDMVKISDEAKEVALKYDTLDEAGKQAFRDLLNIVAKRP